MKKANVLIITVIMAIFFIGCGDSDSNEGSGTGAGVGAGIGTGASTGTAGTKLTISNNSLYNLVSVSWNGQSFGDLNRGTSQTKIFNEGGLGYIFFECHIITTLSEFPIILEARTQDIVILGDEDISFNFTNSTMVAYFDDPARSLSDFVNHYSNMRPPAHSEFKIINNSDENLHYINWNNIMLGDINAGGNQTLFISEDKFGTDSIYFQIEFYKEGNKIVLPVRTNAATTINEEQDRTLTIQNTTMVVFNNEEPRTLKNFIDYYKELPLESYAKLTITNDSSSDLQLIRWNKGIFGFINKEDTKSVYYYPGTNSLSFIIYLQMQGGGLREQNGKTEAVITMEAGDEKTFTFNDLTNVIGDDEDQEVRPLHEFVDYFTNLIQNPHK